MLMTEYVGYKMAVEAAWDGRVGPLRCVLSAVQSAVLLWLDIGKPSVVVAEEGTGGGSEAIFPRFCSPYLSAMGDWRTAHRWRLC